jgi:hypothetical protein
MERQLLGRSNSLHMAQWSPKIAAVIIWSFRSAVRLCRAFSILIVYEMTLLCCVNRATLFAMANTNSWTLRKLQTLFGC